ncbi:MAG: hypothetical protein ABIT70_05735 [Sulfuriferula sp.]
MQTIIHSNAEVFEIARQANAQHLHIITDGERTVLSPIVLPGWHKLCVKIKQQKAAA